MNIEQYRPIFPMAYLFLSITAAIAFHFFGVPDTIGGIIIGAAMTRVKQGATAERPRIERREQKALPGPDEKPKTQPKINIGNDFKSS